jgi:hypothetical protein
VEASPNRHHFETTCPYGRAWRADGGVRLRWLAPVWREGSHRSAVMVPFASFSPGYGARRYAIVSTSSWLTQLLSDPRRRAIDLRVSMTVTSVATKYMPCCVCRACAGRILRTTRCFCCFVPACRLTGGVPRSGAVQLPEKPICGACVIRAAIGTPRRLELPPVVHEGQLTSCCAGSRAGRNCQPVGLSAFSIYQRWRLEGGRAPGRRRR